jgi:hypothetical protein
MALGGFRYGSVQNSAGIARESRSKYLVVDFIEDTKFLSGISIVDSQVLFSIPPAAVL